MIAVGMVLYGLQSLFHANIEVYSLAFGKILTVMLATACTRNFSEVNYHLMAQ